MTVHRVGPLPDTTTQHRTELGRVLVTIDDLAALRTFLTRLMAGEIQIEFDGGYFTEPEDLRTLSDMEMQSLRLKTPKIQIALNYSTAFAIGDRQEAEDVYRIWARARQTRIRARPLPKFLVLMYVATLLLIGTLIMLSTVFTSSLTASASQLVQSILGLALALAAVWYFQSINKPSCYAVIVPLSLAEHRQLQSSQRYPRLSWLVAIMAVIVAAVAILANVLLP